jgi:hypothetical protein
VQLIPSHDVSLPCGTETVEHLDDVRSAAPHSEAMQASPRGRFDHRSVTHEELDHLRPASADGCLERVSARTASTSTRRGYTAFGSLPDAISRTSSPWS